jgi:hypothetical protein
MAEAVLDRMERKILELFPGIEQHILWKHRTNLSYIISARGLLYP